MKKKFNRSELSSLITSIEQRKPAAMKRVGQCFSKDSLKRTICFTGPGGVGKSSLLSQLSSTVCQERSVAWLACDPTSLKSGGSLLGDRIRLSGADLSDRLFLRSLATRSTRAYSQSIRDMSVYLENYFDWVWIESAGSGQTQQEIASLAGITVIVLQPEIGDDIQWMKAGLIEWADFFIIQKSDLKGSEDLYQSLLSHGVSANRLCKVSALKREGFREAWKNLMKVHQEIDWNKKLDFLHESLAKDLYFESGMAQLEKNWIQKKRLFLKSPYRA